MTVASIVCVPGSIATPAEASAFWANGSGTGPDRSFDDRLHAAEAEPARSRERLRLVMGIRDGLLQGVPVLRVLIGA